MRTQTAPRTPIEAPQLMSIQRRREALRRTGRRRQRLVRSPPGRGRRADRAERRGQVDDVQPHHGRRRLSAGEIFFKQENITNAPLHRRSAMGMARTFQIVRLFSGLTVLENVMLGFHPQLVDGFIPSLLRFRKVAADERRSLAAGDGTAAVRRSRAARGRPDLDICRTGSSVLSKSRGRWRASPASCCSTNRPRA